jgi:hypothetical protein
MDNLLTGDVANIEHLFGRNFVFVKHNVSDYIHVSGPPDVVRQVPPVLHRPVPEPFLDQFYRHRPPLQGLPIMGIAQRHPVQPLTGPPLALHSVAVRLHASLHFIPPLGSFEILANPSAAPLPHP